MWKGALMAGLALLLLGGPVGCSDDDNPGNNTNLNANDNTNQNNNNAPPGCGNGVRDAGEECDGSDLGTSTCVNVAGLAQGELACTGHCEFDTGGCYQCGNGELEAAEECDGTHLQSQTCASLGHDGGILYCSDQCLFDDRYCVAAPTVYQGWDDAPVCQANAAADCTLSDLTWMAAEYGTTLTRHDGGREGPAYRLIAYVERVGPSNIDVFVVGPDGNPLAGIPVAFYYSSAPTPSRPDEWYSVKVEAVTDAVGRAGHALGGGAYLPCCGCGGPHAIWVSEPGPNDNTTIPSDLVDHLGMLGGTNHRHLDLLFQLVDPPPATPPADAVHCPLQ